MLLAQNGPSARPGRWHLWGHGKIACRLAWNEEMAGASPAPPTTVNDMEMLKGKTLLITGGTGTIGHAIVDKIKDSDVHSIRVFSRDEQKQEAMARKYSQYKHKLRFILGDVRDEQRLTLACKGVDYLIHAAALKIVPGCFYNPLEAKKTNIDGTCSVIAACLANYVHRAVMLSTDKACEPVTLYGATKAAAECIFLAANNYVGDLHTTRFTAVRYGNVVGSRGSILHVFLKQRESGEITVTDPRSTRFWLEQQDAVNLIFMALENTSGGEVWVPKAPSMRVTDLAKAVAGDARVNIVGLRTQEKLHETLITYEEARRAKELSNCFVIEPEGAQWARSSIYGAPLQSGFRYVSSSGLSWVSEETFKSQAVKYAQNAGNS